MWKYQKGEVNLQKARAPRTGRLAKIFRSQPTLSPEEEKFAIQNFNYFDTEQKGHLEKGELPSLFRHIKLKMEDKVYQIDLLINPDAVIDYFALSQKNEEDALKVFKAYDDNNNGFIEKNELQNLMCEMGILNEKEKNTQKFKETLQQLFSSIDLNRDGLISFEEFIQFHNRLIDLIEES